MHGGAVRRTSRSTSGRSESVQNIWRRYGDIERALPEELRGDALPYFVDWLIENVHLVEITAYSDEDAYTIFETMNDRGLSLTPDRHAEGISARQHRRGASATAPTTRWRDRIQELNDAGKEVEADFFKAWLRSQYADKDPGAHARAPRQRISTASAPSTTVGCVTRATRSACRDATTTTSSSDTDFDFYSRQYLRLIEASQRPVARD